MRTPDVSRSYVHAEPRPYRIQQVDNDVARCIRVISVVVLNRS